MQNEKTLDEAIEYLNWLCNTVDTIGTEHSISYAIAELTSLCQSNKPVKPAATYERIAKMFAVAKSQGIQWPELAIGTPEFPLTLKPNAKGVINITNGERYGTANNRYFGRIYADNKFQFASTVAAPEVESITGLIQAFNEAPAEYAKILAESTGNCMFCRRNLTHPISLLIGYGPTCATNYGLPWDIEDENNPKGAPF